MMKRIVALAAAVAMMLVLAACRTGSGANDKNGGNANLNGKAYTQQAFEGAMETGVLTPAVNAAGELVTASQQSGQAAVVTVWGADGKKKSAVTTDVTDTVTQFALGAKDEVYLLAQPTGGIQTVHVLDANGKTVKKIELEGMKVAEARQSVVNANNSGKDASAGAGAATASPAASANPDATAAVASAAADATATPQATARQGSNNQGGNNRGDNGGFNMNFRSQISAMAAAPDGGVLVSAMGSGVMQFDASGKQVRTLGEGSIVSYLAMNESNQLIVYSMGGRDGQGGMAPTLKTYDVSSGNEVASVEVSGISNIQALFYDKAGKRLLYMTDADVRVLNADGKVGDSLAAFSDFSLLNGARQITGFAVDGSGTIYLAAYNSDASTGGSSGNQGPALSIAGRGGFGGDGVMFTFGGSGTTNEIIRLGLVDASTIKERKVITMAAVNSSRILNQAISAFQIANPDYKIELKVYNTQVQGFRRQAGGNGGQFDVSSLTQAMNTDLMSGKGADILVLDSLPWYKYIDKGLLTDLSQLMTDKQFDASQYYGNIFDACKVGGKLYGIPMSFSYSVLTGKKATMPDGQSPTLAEFIQKAKALPEGITPFARQDALQIFYSYLRYSYADVVDTANRQAHFDSPEFIQAMKDFKDLIGENTSSDNNQDFQARQLDGSVAYNIESMNNPMALAMSRAVLGDDLVYTNVPTMSGSGEGAFTASLMLGINANSQNKDAAWAFIQSMLGSDLQGSGRLDGYPVLKSAAQAIVDDMEEGSGNTGFERRMVLRMGDREIEVKPLTDADYQAILDTLPKLNKLQSIDPNIQQVLSEELPTFFSGQKTAEEVAGLIQNRVNTVLNE